MMKENADGRLAIVCNASSGEEVCTENSAAERFQGKNQNDLRRRN